MKDTKDKNIFHLRFFENGITPESFSCRELGLLIIGIEDSIRSVIDSKFPNIEPDEVNISLVQIENKSESLAIYIDGKSEAQEAFLYWGNSINDNTYTNLPEKAFAGVRLVHSYVQRKGCKSSLTYEDKPVYSIAPDFEIIKPENVTLKNQTTIYGELIKVGGAKPKLWVKLLNGKLLDFFVSKEQAQQLSPKVYTEVALKGEAKWNILTKDLIGFKLYDSIEYKVGGVSKAFKQLREISSGFWDTLKTDDEITNYLKD